MIQQIRFDNFKALRNTALKLGPFNVIIGPNGSGKSSVLQALQALTEPNSINWDLAATAGMQPQTASIAVRLNVGNRADELKLGFAQQFGWTILRVQNGQLSRLGGIEAQEINSVLSRIKVFSFDAASLGKPVQAKQINELQRDGKNLVGALTHLRDKDEEAYDQLRIEFQRWIPEYDGIIFDNGPDGLRHLKLRQKGTKQQISASQVSEGTLLALTLLTIVYQPAKPVLVGLEEPDRGLHPRLLRELRDALYRLSFPTDFGIKREPIQVVVTTHSPFFLDLFKDHPEQIIIAEKQAGGISTFKNLSDDPKLRETIGDAPLGEVWYSGVLGGVPIPA